MYYDKNFAEVKSNILMEKLYKKQDAEYLDSVNYLKINRGSCRKHSIREIPWRLETLSEVPVVCH